MENQQRQLIKKYVDLLLYRWKLFFFCLFLALTVATVMYLLQPKVYHSVSLLTYEQQQINPSRMDPEGERRRLQDTVSTLSQLVMSRKNLVGIIDQFSLYPGLRQEVPIEDVIETMRLQIAITPSRRGDTFSVSFQGGEQEKVMKVTNALASKFIEENLKYREERATETSKYTQDELSMAKVVLDKKEQSMRDYKLKFYNEMPEQRESNLARLTALIEQGQGIQDSIQDLERTKVLVQEQIAIRKRIISAYPLADSGTVNQPTLQSNSPYDQLNRQLRRLDLLLVKYTEKHPEVRRIKTLIANLEKEIDSQGGTTGDKAGGRSLQQSEDPAIQQLRLQLKEVGLNIQGLRQEQKKIPGEISKYQEWIAAAPIREAEWNALTRDYEELRRHYDYLVSQNLQAGSVEHMERKQKGSKFKIVDPARYPDKPFKPEFLKFMLLAIGGGFGVSLALIFLFDFMDTSFKDVDQVEDYLGLSVVSSVPYIETAKEASKKKLLFIISVILFSLYGSALLAALFYLWKKGLIIV